MSPTAATDLPRISLVMPNLNYGRFLEEAIRSILDQEYPNLEFIMVDGGSTDQSRVIIDRYRSFFSRTIIEPDEGQADAINKGLALATGEIFQWINADDLLEPGALFTVARGIQGHDAVAGICTNFDSTGTREPVTLARLSARKMVRHPAKVSYHQPALWLRTRELRACGGIDARFHYMFDYDMTIRYLNLFPRVHYIDRPLVRFRLHSQSKTTKAPSEFRRERREIIEKLADHGSPRIRRTAQRMKGRMEWWDRLEKIETSPFPKRTRIARILREAFSRPSMRIGKGTLRSIARIARES